LLSYAVLSLFSFDYLLFSFFLFLFFSDTATTEIYTLSLHDALPIYLGQLRANNVGCHYFGTRGIYQIGAISFPILVTRLERKLRSEEHTSELQSRFDLVCRLLLEKKNMNNTTCSASHNKYMHEKPQK